MLEYVNKLGVIMKETDFLKLEDIISEFERYSLKDIDDLRNLKYREMEPTTLLNLIRLAQDDDKRALTILVKYYYPFILRTVSRYYINGMDIEDMVMAAVLSFIETIKKYTKGQLNTMIYNNIVRVITKDISFNFTFRRLSLEFSMNIFKYLEYLEKENIADGELSLDDLALKLKISKENLEEIISLINLGGFEIVNGSVIDLKAGDDDYDDTEEIMKIFDRYLTPRYAQAMKLYYGADETTALSLLKVATKMNVCKHMVEIFLENSVSNLKKTSAIGKLKEFYYTDYIEVSSNRTLKR